VVASARARVQVVVNKNADERLEIFAHGADKALWHKWQTAPKNGGSGWTSFGGWIDLSTSIRNRLMPVMPRFTNEALE